jgi:hypothetical protein
MDEYCAAYEHADLFYLATGRPPPKCMGNPAFNWRPHGASQCDFSELLDSPLALKCEPYYFVYPSREQPVDMEPALLLTEHENEIVGHIYYPRQRFCSSTIERFAEDFLKFTRVLVQRQERSVTTISLTEPSSAQKGTATLDSGGHP